MLGSNRWCQIHTFNQDSAIVGRDSKGGTMYRYNNTIDQKKWEELLALGGVARAAREAPLPSQQGAAALLPPAGSSSSGGGSAGGADGRNSTMPAVAMPGHIFHAVKW